MAVSPPDPLIRFYSYQQAWLDDASRFKIGMFARQTGKSFTACAELVRDCLAAERAGKAVRWVVLSRGERQAAEAMETAIKPMLRAVELIASDSMVGFGAVQYRALEVKLPSGSRITALPANPDTARGFSANVFLDEFAFHERSREIWAALFPVISRGRLKLRIMSTPNGKGNKFHELMTAEDSVWSRHVCAIHEAVRQGLPRNIEELRAGMSDAELWAQEFALEWRDEAHAWLPYELITPCEHKNAGRPEFSGEGSFYLGVDIAARRDLYVLWALEKQGDALWAREIIAKRGIPFAEQAEILADAITRYRPVRVAMDQTGMGEMPVETAQRRHGSVVEGVLFTASRKLELASRLKESFEDRRLRIPAGDPALRADLHAVRRVIGPTGNARLVVDGETDGHADRFWALALAVSASVQPSLTTSGFRRVALDAPPPAGAHLMPLRGGGWRTAHHNREHPHAD